jgi:hypothetical protein
LTDGGAYNIAFHAFIINTCIYLYAVPLCTLIFLRPADSQAPREESWLRLAAAGILLRLLC